MRSNNRTMLSPQGSFALHVLLVVMCLLMAVSAAFGQAATGTITGTVIDPTGAAIAGANVEVKNSQTGVVYPAVSTNTGNFTVAQLPPGSYELDVTVAGFKKYVHTNLTVTAAEILRQDATLEVGQASEAVTVTAEASQLKTESGDINQHITVEQLNNMPVLGIGAANSGSSGVRNPYNSMVLIPGVNYAANFVMVVNGAPSNTAAYRLEGLDNTNHTVSYALQENQPSADAIQEVAIQTSNYAPEFGTAGGGLFNLTMKSGTNGFHGTGYEYFVSEDLNAGYPFSQSGNGNKVIPRNRRNDFGGTLGGPVFVPKLYNGRDKTFFFFSYEQYREGNGYTPPLTLPTDAYRKGDFSAISPNGGTGFNPGTGVPAGALPSTDALGRPIFANTIYDPATRKIAQNGVAYADPFPNNIIPQARFDPTALKIQSLLPAATNSGLINNGVGFNNLQRATAIPSLKIDQTTGSKGHASFYWSTTQTDAQFSFPNGNADGLPDLISGARGTFIHALTVRLNYDYTLTPTLLLHAGAGYSRIWFFDGGPVRNFDCAQIALAGCQASIYFPTIGRMIEPGSGSGLGGLQQLGNSLAHTNSYTERPAYNANLTWVRGNHTYKIGGEVWFQGAIAAPPSGTQLLFDSCTGVPACTTTSTAIANGGATALPQVGLNLNGWQTGFPYANFLLGDVTQISQKAPTDTRMGKSQWALFLQDSWKVTRKLTVDYGVRWDYATAPHEQYGRASDLGNVANPAAGGRIGAPIFEATCNCSFYHNYPYAIGPRLGVAYQITPKTVLRGGWGFAYGFAPDVTAATASQIDSAPAGSNAFFNLQTPGVMPQPVWPNLDPGQTPLPGQTTGFNGFTSYDANIARPPRQNQWSIGLQREISPSIVVEASYVGNRGVWWTSGGVVGTGPLGLVNQVSPAAFAAYGLHPYTNPDDNLLLGQAINSAPVISRVGTITPYAGYPTTSTLINALRPYPQFSSIAVTGSPTGKTWYDSLQVRGNKRFSHGLQATATFTWSKAMILTREDIFNPASSGKSIQPTDQPFLFNAGINYTTPRPEFLSFKPVQLLVKDWTVGAILQYGSGLPLTPPAANTVNNLGTSEQFRVPGQPLYLKDLNCGCINPATDQVLNPAAWANPVNGAFGPGPVASTTGGLYYTDFRQARRPQENLNFGRNFRIREGMNLQIRAEFVNIFNRTQIGNPGTSNPQAAPQRDNLGRYTSGFGVYSGLVGLANGATPSYTQNAAVGALYQQPRSGTLIARFTF